MEWFKRNKLEIIIISISLLILIGVSFATERKEIKRLCISGYEFVVGKNHHNIQIVDKFGRGIECNEETH